MNFKIGRAIAGLAVAFTLQNANALFLDDSPVDREFFRELKGVISKTETAHHYKMVINGYGDWNPLNVCTDEEISRSLKKTLKLTRKKSAELIKFMEAAAAYGFAIRVQYYRGTPPVVLPRTVVRRDGQSCVVDAAVFSEESKSHD